MKGDLPMRRQYVCSQFAGLTLQIHTHVQVLISMSPKPTAGIAIPLLSENLRLSDIDANIWKRVSKGDTKFCGSQEYVWLLLLNRQSRALSFAYSLHTKTRHRHCAGYSGREINTTPILAIPQWTSLPITK